MTARALGRTVDEVASDVAKAGIPSSCPATATAAKDGMARESSFHRKSRSADGLPDLPACQLPVETDERDPTCPPLVSPYWARRPAAAHARPRRHSGLRRKKQGQTDIYRGREVHLIADVPDLGSEPVPAFIRGAGDDRLEGGLAALDNLGHTPEVLLADCGYSFLTAWASTWSGAASGRRLTCTRTSAREARTAARHRLGGRKPGQRGALPTCLRSLPAYQQGMTRGDRRELASTYDQRLPYLYTRWAPPTRGPAGSDSAAPPSPGGSAAAIRPPRCGCVARGGGPTTACRPGVECGCDRTVTLTPEEHGRTFQTAPYGTTGGSPPTTAAPPWSRPTARFAATGCPSTSTPSSCAATGATASSWVARSLR